MTIATVVCTQSVRLCISFQVNELKKELDAQNREKNTLEVRSNEAQKKMDKIISKLEKVSGVHLWKHVCWNWQPHCCSQFMGMTCFSFSLVLSVLIVLILILFFAFCLQLQNTNEEQKSKIQKLQRALKVAEVLYMVVLLLTCILWNLIVSVLAIFLYILRKK